MARPIGPDDFEALFRKSADPWDYETSAFEAHKRRVLLRHIGLRGFGRVLELACANGVTTQSLLGRSLRITATDASASALHQAKARLRDQERVTFVLGRLPSALPRRRFDLIVISEIVYYLDRNACRVLATNILKSIAPAGRVVILHHHISFPDASVLPASAHLQFVGLLRRKLIRIRSQRTGRFQVDSLAAARRY